MQYIMVTSSRLMAQKILSDYILKYRPLLYLSLLSMSCLASANQDIAIEKSPKEINALTPFHAKYKVTRGRITLGTATRQLSQIAKNRYTFSYNSDLSFLILSDERKESSELNIINNKVVPLKYLFKREGTGSNLETILNFDPEKSEITDVVLNRIIDCDKKVNWLDQISYQLQMKIDIAAGLNEFEYYLIDDDKREKHYKFKIVGKEKLTTPSGEYDTIKIQRIRKKSKRLTEFWVAPKLGYLLVRIRQEKSGSEQADVQLESVSFSQ